MRALVAHWPRTLGEWLPGLALSIPLGALLWLARGQPDALKMAAASLAVLLAVPWIVPAIVVVGVLSAPVYMALHTQGPVPDVLSWLGGVVLVSALIGSHVNAALAAVWWACRRGLQPEPGLREFLGRGSRH